MTQQSQGQEHQQSQQTSDFQESGDLMANYKFERGGNWSPDYVRTILQWIHICSINLDVMTEASFHYKRLIRRNTILSLLMSTITSTASFTQFNISEQSYPGLSLAIKVIITVLATVIALSSGFIKIYQIQEKLEKAIKLQQEWTTFGSTLSSELQLPIKLRKDALYLIIKYKDIYTELFKQQADVSKKIITRVALRNDLEPNDLMLSELFERILYAEAAKMKIDVNEDNLLNKTSNLNTLQSKSKENIILDMPITKLTYEPNIITYKTESREAQLCSNEYLVRKEPELLVAKLEVQHLDKDKTDIDKTDTETITSQNTVETAHTIEQIAEQSVEKTEITNEVVLNSPSNERLTRTSLSGVLLGRTQSNLQTQQQQQNQAQKKEQQQPQQKQANVNMNNKLVAARDRLKKIVKTDSQEFSSPKQSAQRKMISSLLV